MKIAGSTAASVPSGHLVRLDVMRAAAILTVFIYHLLGLAYGAYTFPWNHEWLDFSAAPASSFYLFYPISFFWTGVPLFFVISGFCIHYAFLKSDTFSTPSFYARRFWRIYPSYLFCLVVLSAIQKLNGAPPDARQFFSHLFLVHNLSQKTIFGINIPFWSLGTEVQLYLIYPIFLWLRARRGVLRAFVVASGVSVIARLPAALLTDWNQDLAPSLWESPLVLWFDWTLGAYLAEAYLKKRRVFNFGNEALCILIGFFWLSTIWKYANTLSFSLASLIWGILLEKYLWSERDIALIWRRILAPIGLCSYSLYLWHFPLQRHLLPALARIHIAANPIFVMTFGFVLTFGISFIISWSLYRFLELPGLAFGKRVSPQLSGNLKQRQSKLDWVISS